MQSYQTLDWQRKDQLVIELMFPLKCLELRVILHLNTLLQVFLSYQSLMLFALLFPVYICGLLAISTSLLAFDRSNAV